MVGPIIEELAGEYEGKKALIGKCDVSEKTEMLPPVLQVRYLHHYPEQ